MNQRGNRTPEREATAMVITTGSAIMPRKALGKPNTLACQLAPTRAQSRTALMEHASSALGSAASRIAS